MYSLIICLATVLIQRYDDMFISTTFQEYYTRNCFDVILGINVDVYIGRYFIVYYST